MVKQNNLPTDTEIDVKELATENIKKKISNESSFQKSGLKLLLLIVVTIVIASLLGGISGKLLSKKTTKIQTYKITKPVGVFPIDITILQNTMFSEWSGRLKGRIKELKANSFLISEIKENYGTDGKTTVTDSGNTNLTEIQIVPQTKFFISTTSASFGQKPTPIAFKDLKINQILEGSVKIKYENSILKLIGASFTLR